MVSAEDDNTAGCLIGWQPTLLALYLSPPLWKLDLPPVPLVKDRQRPYSPI